MRPASDRCGDRFASGMSYPEVCLSGGTLLCLSGVLADEKVKKGNGCVENGFVKQSFTHRLATQAILIICKCKILQAVFALQLINCFLRRK